MNNTDSFATFGLSQETLDALAQAGITIPTPIQAQTIGPMLNWHDIIGKAPTGTGKTLAFGIPILEHLDPALQPPQALILAPTRELVLQITGELIKLAAGRPHARIVAIYGGQSIGQQIEALRNHPQIIVATPGRLIDHLNRRTLTLDQVQTVVLDEADRMLDMGFIRDVRKILDKMPRVGQIAMFSATLSRAVMDISWIYQRDPVEVTIAEDETNKPPITQYSISLGGHARVEATVRIIQKEGYARRMVCCNTKGMVEGVTRRLNRAGCKADCIHGDIRQSQREKVLASFRHGHLPVIVCTDVAARGLDIFGVDAVFNYDVPLENESYTHRIGRTGRAHHPGVAYTFYAFLDKIRLDEIVRYTKTPLIPLDPETLEPLG
jgi:ATP-dependent RNA helicase DeaD